MKTKFIRSELQYDEIQTQNIITSMKNELDRKYPSMTRENVVNNNNITSTTCDALTQYLPNFNKIQDLEVNESINEIDVYLSQSFLKNHNDDHTKVLEWWKLHSENFPRLSRMAADYLSCPLTSVPSECAFSTAGRVISDYRSSLKSSSIEMLMQGESWLKYLNKSN